MLTLSTLYINELTCSDLTALLQVIIPQTTSYISCPSYVLVHLPLTHLDPYPGHFIFLQPLKSYYPPHKSLFHPFPLLPGILPNTRFGFTTLQTARQIIFVPQFPGKIFSRLTFTSPENYSSITSHSHNNSIQTCKYSSLSSMD